MTPERADSSKLVLVYGAGGHSLSVIGVIEHEDKWTVAGVVDDGTLKDNVMGYQVLGGVSDLPRIAAEGITKAHVAIGDNFARAEAARALTDGGIEIVQVTHPSMVVMKDACMGAGGFYHCYSIVGPEARVGTCCIVSAHTSVAHESELGDFVHLSPAVQLGGGVRIGSYSSLGLGAAVMPGVTLGQNVVVGANAVVRNDLPDNAVAVGVPARVVRVEEPRD